LLPAAAHYFSVKKVMVHISEVGRITEKGEFSLEFVGTGGDVIRGERCICTSFHSQGRTMNIKFCDSGQIRKVRRCSIISINNQEVVL